MDLVDLDTECWWLWCGTECSGAFIGPHPSSESAAADANAASCDHNHATFRMTLRQMAAKIPASGWFHAAGVHDYRTGEPLICTPTYPHTAVEFSALGLALLRLQLTGAPT